MKTIQRCSRAYALVLAGLLMSALVVPGLLHALVPSISGQINVVHISQRAIDVDGARHRVASDAEIFQESDTEWQPITINQLRAGQYIDFIVDSAGFIIHIRIIDGD